MSKNPIDNKTRDRIKTEFDRNFLVEASAGTGKTTCLVGRITNALTTKKAEPEEVAAITFTNRAADELKSRIIEELFKKQAKCKSDVKKQNRISEIIKRLGNARISTIHSFYQQMLSELPLEAELDTDLKIMEEDSKIPDDVWNDFKKEKFSEFERIDELYFVFQNLGINMKDFRDFCFVISGYPDLEIAHFPRTGINKDEMIDSCIQQFEKVLNTVDAFTGVPASGKDYEYVRAIRSIKNTWRDLESYENEEKIVYVSRQQALPKLRKKDIETWFEEGQKEQVKKLWAAKKEAETGLKDIKEIVSHYIFDLACELFEHFDKFFEDYKKRHSVITFVDSLKMARDLLKTNEVVRKYFRDKYKMILVDEFQDTDPLQAEVLAMLCSESNELPDDWRKINLKPGKFFAVGDPKQSIFRFRRADIRIYEQFKNAFFDEKGEVAILEENFRSAGGITDPVNEFFKERIKKKEDFSSPEYKKIHPNRGKGGNVVYLKADLTMDSDRENIKKYFPGGKEEKGLKSGYIREREPVAFAGWLKQVLDSGKYEIYDPVTKKKRKMRAGDILLLFYRKKCIHDWAKALESRNIPCEDISGEKFYQRKEVKEALSLLRSIAYPSDSLAEYGALKSPLFGITDRELYEEKHNIAESENLKTAVKLLNNLRKKIHETDHHTAARYLLEESGMLYLYSEVLKNKPATSALVKLSSMAEEIGREEGLDFPAIVRRLMELKEENVADLYIEEEQPSGVRLMTTYKAKGQEAPVVVLGDMSYWRSKSKSDRVSIVTDRDSNKLYYRAVFNRVGASENSKNFESKPEDWENSCKKSEKDFVEQEERRLEYVSCTRARDYLFVLGTENRDSRVFYNELQKYLEGSGITETVEIKYTNYKNVENKEEAEPQKEASGIDIEKYGKELERKIKEFNKRVYEKRVPSKLDEEIYGKEEGYGKEHGNIVHEILAELIYNPEKEIDYTRYEKKETVKKHVKKAVQSNIWNRARKSEFYTEFPFTLYDEKEETLLRGSIDLIFKEKQEWVLVDYKTNKIESPETERKLKEHYGPQLEIYKKAFETITGCKVKERKLFFLDKEDRLQGAEVSHINYD